MMEEDEYTFEEDLQSIKSIDLENADNFSKQLKKMVHKLKDNYHYPFDVNYAKNEYINCVKSLVVELKNHYQNFIDKKKLDKHNLCDDDEYEEFMKYLIENDDAYVDIKNTFRKKIVLLLDQKFKIKYSTWDNVECQNFIGKAYTYLIEEMHEALNSSFDGEIVFKKNKYHFKINSWYILEESYELGNLKVARNHYLELIGKNKKDPDAWLKYGIYLKKINDPERSLECCLESISLQNRHNLSLIYYGVLLMENDKHDEAEFFLKACVNFYPLKFENWMILYLFYAKINLSPEIDVTLKNAKDCIADENYKKMIFDDVIDEPFAWSTFQHHQQDQIHITITIFLLKLNLFMLADFALLKYLEQFGESISWIYFSAVSFYLQGKFSEALEKLQEAISKHGKDYSIMSLMGHCLFRKNNLHEAIECYEFCNFIFDRPDDMHLVNLRLANCYVEFEQYKKAKKKFFDICKLTPTSASWLGLGSSCYHLGELIESELCLVEANLIDNCNPEIWGYLTLINISLDNYHEFLQCYRQTIENNLDNNKLSKLIDEAIKNSNFQNTNIIYDYNDN